MPRSLAITGTIGAALLTAIMPVNLHAEDAAPSQTAIARVLILDQASLLSEGFEGTIAGQIEAIEDRTSLNIAIMTVPSLMGANPEDLAGNALDKWKQERPARLSAMLLLAPRERTFTVQIRMPVDFESYQGRDDAYWFDNGVLPPSYRARIKSVIEPAVVPFFKESDWEGGIQAAIDAVNEMIGDARAIASDGESKPSS